MFVFDLWLPDGRYPTIFFFFFGKYVSWIISLLNFEKGPHICDLHMKGGVGGGGGKGVRVLKFPLHMFMDSIVFKNVSNNKSMVYLCGCAFWLVETLWLVENIISECLNYSSIVSKDSMNRFNEMFSLARMLAVMHRGFLTPHPRVAPKMLILNRVKMRSSILQNNNIKQKANWR